MQHKQPTERNRMEFRMPLFPEHPEPRMSHDEAKLYEIGKSVRVFQARRPLYPELLRGYKQAPQYIRHLERDLVMSLMDNLYKNGAFTTTRNISNPLEFRELLTVSIGVVGPKTEETRSVMQEIGELREQVKVYRNLLERAEDELYSANSMSEFYGDIVCVAANPYMQLANEIRNVLKEKE